MNVFYREPELISDAVDHVNGVEVWNLPTVTEVHEFEFRPYIARYMNMPLSDLVNKALQSYKVNAVNRHRRSGVRYPEPIDATRRFDGRDLSIEEVGLLGVRFLKTEAQVYVLDRVPDRTLATILGIVDFRGEGDEGFTNGFGLDSDLSRELSRYALGQYRLRSTIDEFND